METEDSDSSKEAIPLTCRREFLRRNGNFASHSILTTHNYLQEGIPEKEWKRKNCHDKTSVFGVLQEGIPEKEWKRYTKQKA